MKPSELTDEQLSDILDGLVSTETLDYEDAGPGKFEGNANPGLTQAIYDRSLDTSWLDNETGTVEWDRWVGLIGRFLLLEDGQGFVELEEHADAATAQQHFSWWEHQYQQDWPGDQEA